ncbi:MAG: hypothetical protein N4A72_12985, partial [Bacteroidales bacterium]|nr:hypothetical protein [Bacteroidales bacterium]
DLSIDQGIYVMPAYAYYLLIKAANDRLIEQNLQSLFFAVTAITPFDEFFLIGKALKYSYKGLKSVNYVKARNLLSIKPCVLKPKYKKLFAGHTEKLKKYVKFGEDVVNISEDLIRSYKKGITTRIAKTKGFSLIHSDDELIAIIKKGIELKIPRDEIEDFIFVSCRDAKLINATDLIQQMDNWINVIKKRGYPYKFASKPEFTKFSNELRSGLDDLNISTSDIRIQGSSLRTPDAKDVDLAVIISDIEFNNILINRFSGRITKNKVEIDISSMKTSELRNLALEIESAPSDLFNGQARSFQTAYLNRKISAYSNDKIIPGMKQLYTKIKNEYKGLNIENISVQTSGGSMDLKPFIKI